MGLPNRNILPSYRLTILQEREFAGSKRFKENLSPSKHLAFAKKNLKHLPTVQALPQPSNQREHYADKSPALRQSSIQCIVYRVPISSQNVAKNCLGRLDDFQSPTSTVECRSVKGCFLGKYLPGFIMLGSARRSITSAAVDRIPHKKNRRRGVVGCGKAIRLHAACV